MKAPAIKSMPTKVIHEHQVALLTHLAILFTGIVLVWGKAEIDRALSKRK
jgi:hypothetical protein